MTPTSLAQIWSILSIRILGNISLKIIVLLLKISADTNGHFDFNFISNSRDSSYIETRIARIYSSQNFFPTVLFNVPYLTRSLSSFLFRNVLVVVLVVVDISSIEF